MPLNSEWFNRANRPAFLQQVLMSPQKIPCLRDHGLRQFQFALGLLQQSLAGPQPRQFQASSQWFLGTANDDHDRNRRTRRTRRSSPDLSLQHRAPTVTGHLKGVQRFGFSMALAAVSAVSAVGPGLRCQIKKFQAFIAVPVFSQSPFLKNMAIGWSHVSRFQLRRLRRCWSMVVPTVPSPVRKKCLVDAGSLVDG